MDSAVIITGASGEIGSAIAELFAEKGYNVCLCGHSKSKEGKLIEKAKELEARYHICTAVASLDVAIKEDCERVVAQFKEKFGTITTLVNSAGITDFGVFLRAKENDYHSIISSNLDGAFFMMQAVGKIMKKQRNGSIVNISSMAGIKGCPGSAVYSASKGAINSLTRTAAAELAVYGVRVNAVAPGRIEGGMSAMFADEEREMLASCSAMKRFGKPMDKVDFTFEWKNGNI